MRLNASRTLRTVAKLAAVTLAGKNALSTANAQAAYSQRVNPPTLDTLQQCDAQQLAHFEAFLTSLNAYAPDMAMLCVDEPTYDRYNSRSTSESVTNCYGDALGIAGRINPRGVFLGDVHSCETLNNGALKDGAVPAENDACPDFTRKMQFYISEDRLDYHVISRGPLDAAWMNKFTATPRFAVSLTDETVPQLAGSGITWIVKNAQGDVRVTKQVPQNYPIRCPEILCSLPEKHFSPQSDL